MTRLALALVLLAFPASATAAPLEVGPGKLGVSRIGDFRPQQDATVAAAQAVFGQPSSAKAQGSACTMRWRDVGLKIVFANFGGAPEGEDTCSPEVGLAQSFRATGEFVTWRGLRVGARRGAIRRKHPSADRHARSYWLKTATSPFGEGGRYAVVKAVVAGGKVSALSGWIGAAGE